MGRKKEKPEVYHDSHQLVFRNPQGAAPIKSCVTIGLEVKAKWEMAACFVKVYYASGLQRTEEMVYQKREGGKSFYEVSIQMPEQPGLVYYYFMLNDGGKFHYYGAASGEGEFSPISSVESYQITVYDPNFHTPDWLKRAVIYQIFVDRYARGKKRGGLDRVSYHINKGRQMYIHDDWNEEPIYAPLPGETEYDPCDFFGGDLQGVIEHLPDLANMGITCLYLNPIFEAVSNHKYNTSNYEKIDPMFGDEAIFKELCQKAGELGIRIMLDGVFSHTGDDSIYFNKYGRYDSVGAYQSKDSLYYPWYTFTDFPNAYRSWWGFSTLPEVNEMNAEYRSYIIESPDSIVKKWLRLGASAWRLDVADELPDAFIKLLRKAVKEVDPNHVVLGEVWEDASNKISMNTKREYVMGDELDSVMNYPMRALILDCLLGKIDMWGLQDRMEILREHYPKEFFYSCMNMLSNHDVPRALSLLGGAPDKDSGLTREEQANYTLSSDQREVALRRMRLAVLMQMVIPGAPCIYYGDEVGLEGLMDPFNRRTYPWDHADLELKEYVSVITKLRNQSAVLQTGCMMLHTIDADCGCCIRFSHDGKDAFGQPCKSEVWLSVINRSSKVMSVSLWKELTQAEFDGPDAELAPDFEGMYEQCLEGGKYMLNADAPDLLILPYKYCLLRKTF